MVADNLFQTPPALAARLVALAEIQPGQSVLEPSAGLGRLLREILRRSPGSVTACEIAPACAAELFREFPGVTLLQRDFLSIPPAREGNCSLIVKHTPHAFYDRIVMNPPFRMRSDIRHVLHARRFLAAGGILAGLRMSGPRRETELRPLCDSWEVIPAGTFRGEGTNVETVLFRLRA